MPQRECGKRSSITFFRFRDAFGHFLVTFSDASVTFFVTFLPNSFCRTPFAAGCQPFSCHLRGLLFLVALLLAEKQREVAADVVARLGGVAIGFVVIFSR